jgi:hypothetical protein
MCGLLFDTIYGIYSYEQLCQRHVVSINVKEEEVLPRVLTSCL